MSKGIINSIERFAIHDGPGIRTTVFLKGCNLSCFWCHSPESISRQPELQIFYQRCVLCGRCATACPLDAHVIEDGHHVFRREKCLVCGACVQSCHEEVLRVCGQAMTCDEVFAEIVRDQEFYQASGGGITISGGEPLLQAEFVMELLEKCRDAGIHTALDTAGNIPTRTLKTVVDGPLNLLIFDLKIMDDALHRKYTGVSNKLILENLQTVLDIGKPLIIRIPVVPGINDNPDNMERCAECLQNAKAEVMVELLGFHHLGKGRYRSLDMNYAAANLPQLTETEVAEFVSIFLDHGIPAEARALRPLPEGRDMNDKD